MVRQAHHEGDFSAISAEIKFSVYAITDIPHAELVEARTALMQASERSR
jgi:hypothetical protein